MLLRKLSSAIVLLVSLVLAGNLALAQTPPKPESPAPPAPSAVAANTAPPAVFKSTAALVLVDVLVSNGAEPIHGIPRSQFTLLEDGKPQTLISLEEHLAANPANVSQPPVLPPGVYTNIGTPVQGAVNVLLLDALNTPMADQAYVRQQMIAYLKNIPPGTRMAIFTLASRLRMVQGFTSDSRPLLAALNTKTPIGKSTLPNQSALLADPSDTTSSDMLDQMSQMGASAQAMASIQQFEADQAAFQMDLRVRYTLDALQQLARYLRGVPGRKNLIWFSGSFPISLDPDATLQNPFDAARYYSADISETSSMLAASRVAVYPVDARGLFGDPALNAASKSNGMSSSSGGANLSAGGSRRGSRSSSSGGSASSPPKMTQGSTRFFQQTAAEHATMQQIADETGGHAYYDTNGIKEAVGQVVQSGANYYTLAYIPAAKTDDGRFHKIQVTVPDAPSYKLVFRRGYVAETAKKQAANTPVSNIAAAVLRGSPPFSEVIFKVRVLPSDDPAVKGLTPQPGAAGELSPKIKAPLERYWLDYATDLHGAGLTETPAGQHSGALEFVAVAYDRDGDRLNFIDKSYTINMTDDQYKQILQKGLQIHQQIDLPAGEVYLRAVVHDLNSDRIGSVEIPLIVKPQSAAK